MGTQIINHCMTCGACCAAYRVSFYWAEIDERNIPSHLVEQLTSVKACMVGTNCSKPRCAALEGEVGKEVRCTAYEHRPSPCHEVEVGDEKCNHARQKCGLPPLVLD